MKSGLYRRQGWGPRKSVEWTSARPGLYLRHILLETTVETGLKVECICRLMREVVSEVRSEPKSGHGHGMKEQIFDIHRGHSGWPAAVVESEEEVGRSNSCAEFLKNGLQHISKYKTQVAFDSTNPFWGLDLKRWLHNIELFSQEVLVQYSLNGEYTRVHIYRHAQTQKYYIKVDHGNDKYSYVHDQMENYCHLNHTISEK